MGLLDLLRGRKVPLEGVALALERQSFLNRSDLDEALAFLVPDRVVADLKVPVAQARCLSRRPVIAVDVGEKPPTDEIASLTLPRALLRGSAMTHQALREASTRTADLVIRPDVGMVRWAEFGRLDELVEAGRVAAAASVPHQRALAQRRGRKAEPVSRRQC